VSLALQQCFRTFIGPKEVSPTLPDWLMGSWAPAEGLDIPINGMFVLALTLVVTAGVLIALHRSRWGLRVRATVSNRVMANAIGIDTRKTDRLTFAIGCGIAGVAGAAFTTIGSTGPTSGSLYIVDAFLVVTFGGAASLLGTVVFCLRHCPDPVDHRVLHGRIHGQGAHPVAHRGDSDDAPAGSVRQQGSSVTEPTPVSGSLRVAPSPLKGATPAVRQSRSRGVLPTNVAPPVSALPLSRTGVTE
jgi:hypothetical protein